MDAPPPTPSAFDDDVEVPLIRPELPPPFRQRVRGWRHQLIYRLTEVPPWAHRPVALTALCAIIAASVVVGSQLALRRWEHRHGPDVVVSMETAPGLLVGITAGLAATVDSDAPTVADSGAVNVHVAGEVMLHGMVTLPSGSRAVDAIKAAGGATDLADLDQVNLARVVVDGDQVLVPAEATPETVGVGPDDTATPTVAASEDPAIAPDQADP